jgi:hypothetical protein
MFNRTVTILLYMCCSCCCCEKQPTPTEPTPPPSTRCTKYRLTIQSIDVSMIDDGLLGGTLEATFTFVVNGVARTYTNNNLDVGITNIGIAFFIDVPTDTSTITLEVSGTEDDPFFDDVLPGFSKVHGQADNWGLGSQSGSANDSSINYKLNYEIVCAQDIVRIVPVDRLLDYGRVKAKMRKKSKSVADNVLVSWSIDRLRRDGWKLTDISGSDYVFQGTGNLPALIEQKAKRSNE